MTTHFQKVAEKVVDVEALAEVEAVVEALVQAEIVQIETHVKAAATNLDTPVEAKQLMEVGSC